MSLRSILLLACVLALAVPVAGMQLLRQFEGLLREAQEQALLASASMLARSLGDSGVSLGDADAGPVLYLFPLSAEIVLDAYSDDWAPYLSQAQQLGSGREEPVVTVLLGQSRRQLYLWMRVIDRTPVRVPPGPLFRAQADQVRLTLELEGRRVRYRFVGDGEGRIEAERLDPPQTGLPLAVVGAWQDQRDGYQLELALPLLPAQTRIGLEVLDWHHPAHREPGAVGGTVDEGGKLVLHDLRAQAPLLSARLQRLAPPGTHVRLLDEQAWVRAQSGSLLEGEFDSEHDSFTAGMGRWLQRRLIANLLHPAAEYAPEQARVRTAPVEAALNGETAVIWRRAEDARTVVRVAAVPIDRGDALPPGVLLMEQTSEALVALTRQAMGALTVISLLTLLFVTSALLALAGMLSWRIRRLRDAAEQALGSEARLQPFPTSRAGDELGDLSRSFSRLFQHLGEYNEYLRTLGSKLSHELHTPLAVVRSSLDNLDNEALPDSARVYVERARDGAQRLGGLLRALSEASRTERAVRQADAEDFDLALLVRQCVAGYASLRPDLDVAVSVPEHGAVFHGAPELIAQLLDKLWDNAASFCPEGGWIRVRLHRADGQWLLAMANEGPALPETMRERLFDSLVSVREVSAGTHLGLGLYIVRLIVERHAGRLLARNLPRDDGVEIVASLRGMPRAPLHQRA